MDWEKVFKNAKIIWDYHRLNQKLEPADVILVLGSLDTSVAERGAELFLQKYAPLIVFSGKVGRLTEGMWNKSEAEVFAEVAFKKGVSPNDVLIENKSKNTGENIEFSLSLLKDKGLNPTSLIIVQKPYMERRAYATFKKICPDKECMVTSPQISFEGYIIKSAEKDLYINIIVGDLQRIKIYPEMGFQIPQKIPKEVWQAYEVLVKMGFNKHLVKS